MSWQDDLRKQKEVLARQEQDARDAIAAKDATRADIERQFHEAINSFWDQLIVDNNALASDLRLPYYNEARIPCLSKSGRNKSFKAEFSGPTIGGELRLMKVGRHPRAVNQSPTCIFVTYHYYTGFEDDHYQHLDETKIYGWPNTDRWESATSRAVCSMSRKTGRLQMKYQSFEGSSRRTITTALPRPGLVLRRLCDGGVELSKRRLKAQQSSTPWNENIPRNSIMIVRDVMSRQDSNSSSDTPAPVP